MVIIRRLLGMNCPQDALLLRTGDKDATPSSGHRMDSHMTDRIGINVGHPEASINSSGECSRNPNSHI